MPCPRCGIENRSDARFCRGCGMRLEPTALPVAPAAAGDPGPDAVIEFPDDFQGASRMAAQETAINDADPPGHRHPSAEGTAAKPAVELPEDSTGASSTTVQVAAVGEPGQPHPALTDRPITEVSGLASVQDAPGDAAGVDLPIPTPARIASEGATAAEAATATGTQDTAPTGGAEPGASEFVNGTTLSPAGLSLLDVMAAEAMDAPSGRGGSTPAATQTSDQETAALPDGEPDGRTGTARDNTAEGATGAAPVQQEESDAMALEDSPAVEPAPTDSTLPGKAEAAAAEPAAGAISATGGLDTSVPATGSAHAVAADAASPPDIPQPDAGGPAGTTDAAMATPMPAPFEVDGDAAPAMVPPFGTEPALSATGDPSDDPAAPLAAADVELSEEGATTHLSEADAPVVAPPVPGEAFPALAVGEQIAGRYQVQQVLQTGPQRQTYQVADLQGHLRCWACGSLNNVQGELYCTDCGAQLTGRTYRLFETPRDASLPKLPPPLLENMHSGVAGVFDSFTDAASGRHYLVLEDVTGRPLSAILGAVAPGEAPPTAAQLLKWIDEAAATLQELHAARIVGCDFTPAALQVLPDERLVLVDPSACQMAGAGTDTHDSQGETQADVQRVAAVLEQWVQAQNPDGEAGGVDDESLLAVLARGREGGFRSAAEFAAAVHDLVLADAPRGDLQLISGRATDVGVQRQLNEDSLFALETVTMEAAGYTPTGIYIVADGMGGHDSGEVASSIVVRTVPALLAEVLMGRITGEADGAHPSDHGRLLRDAVQEANQRIIALSRERGNDMGTTVTMALVVGNQATVANVGDSRTYLWRDGTLKPISQDHSLVARLIAAGQLTAEEGRHFDRRNEIYRALGDAHITNDEIDIFQVTLRPLDALLLCSDGMWEMVRDADMEKIMLDSVDLHSAAQALVDAANRGGGEDNITVIIAQLMTNSED
ncbi:MAG TPA: protein phosphatase 2C domain-containing protein [Chloroflexia bacterium]|nr:protein phosphatase 2C domain-containing protein [Chloroflexia bacterium]